jgi:putative flippase GtrA
MRLPKHFSFKKTMPEIVRYGLGGCSTAVLCWGVLLALVELFKVNYLIASNIAAGVAYVYSYAINKYLVFKNYTTAHVKQGIRYSVLQAIIWVFANALLFAGVQMLHVHYFVMNVFVAAVAAVINYTAMKTVIFGAPETRNGKETRPR